MLAKNHAIVQASWFVEDIDQAAENWLALGYGPFYMVRHTKMPLYRYRGVKTHVDVSGAFVQAGDLQIELIAQHDKQPSQYSDSFGPGQSGFHHVGIFTRDYDAGIAEYERKGCPLVADGVFGEIRFGYFDTRPLVGSMTELIEDKPSIRQFFAMIADAAKNWDGSNPIREIPQG
jgi:hypothetical protein